VIHIFDVWIDVCTQEECNLIRKEQKKERKKNQNRYYQYENSYGPVHVVLTKFFFMTPFP